MIVSPDCGLVSIYAAQGSESAFRALGDRFGELRATLFSELERSLRSERFEQFKYGLAAWMPDPTHKVVDNT